MRLSPNDIVQPVRPRRIDEAIPDPLARLHDIGDIGLEFKRLLDAFVVQLAAIVNVGSIGVTIEAEDVERVLPCDGDEVARSRPVDLRARRPARQPRAPLCASPRESGTHIPRLNINPPHNRPRLPIIKHDESHPLDTEQRAPINPIRRVPHLDQPHPLLEIAKHLDFGSRLPHGVRVGIGSPGEAHSRTKRLVAPRQRGVDDVLAVAADGDEAARAPRARLVKEGAREQKEGDEPAVGRVLQRLGVHFRVAQLARGDRELLTIGRVVICEADGISFQQRAEREWSRGSVPAA